MGDKKLVVDVAKGTSAYIDLTPEEIEQRAVDAQAAAIEKAERDAQEEAKADAKLSAQAKLQALGLTGDEVVALLN
jgi:DNA-binding transcriptional regulator GbsR (MarR family)